LTVFPSFDISFINKPRINLKCNVIRNKGDREKWLILEGKDLNEGNQEVIENVEGFKFPLKIVIAVENDIITVKTNYPLKKGRKE